VVITTSTHSTAATKAASVANSAGPKNMLSDGILLEGSGGTITAVPTAAIPAKGKPTPTDESTLSSTANIVEYVDLQCPVCQAFEGANLTQVTKWVAAGKATLEIHPIAFLDQSSQGTRYSSRADNAMACVANFDPNAFLPAMKAMYIAQPAEGSSGLPNSKILQILASAGASSSSITKCVNNETFGQWVTATTTSVENGSFAGVAKSPMQFPGTPTVFVNGSFYQGSIDDAKAFASFVEQTKPGTTD
jgi:protein-disulfide isomerase